MRRRVSRPTGGETGKDLDLEVHLPALAATAMPARQTKQMLVLLTTYETSVAARRCPYTLYTQK